MLAKSDITPHFNPHILVQILDGKIECFGQKKVVGKLMKNTKGYKL